MKRVSKKPVADKVSPASGRRVAIYARVSGEDQAERGTVQAQIDYLRQWCALNQVSIAAEYIDDGISGAVDLTERPNGRVLVDDARGGRFAEVLVYRLDRLGRRLVTLLDAHTVLDSAGVTIRSATEPFDTSSSIGRFLFQLLASLSELERETISERMSMGRERVAKEGKWTGGPIPIGYDLDANGKPTPSARIVESIGKTEAEVIHELFERIAGGSTSIAEARRFDSLGVSLDRRYGGGVSSNMSKSGTWPSSRIRFIIHNEIYKGRHVLHTPRGDVDRDVTPIVSPELWQAANDRLAKNQSLSIHGKRAYLLRGLIRCGDCGMTFVGTPRTSTTSPGWRGHYYRCGSQLAAVHNDPAKRCRAKQIRAEQLEDEVWEKVQYAVRNPGESLADARAQLRKRMAQSTEFEEERRRLTVILDGKETERERVQTLFRRGRMDLEEAEHQLDEIAREAAVIRGELDSRSAQAELARDFEKRVTSAAVMLAQLQDKMDEAERTNDPAFRRQLVELLVQEITVYTEPSDFGKHKRARVIVRLFFDDPKVASVSNINATTVTPAPRTPTSISRYPSSGEPSS